MKRTKWAVGPLRGMLAAAFAYLVLLQVAFLPGAAKRITEEWPHLTSVRLPMLVGSLLVLACVQAVIVCTWKLLTMVKADRIFSKESLAWVDGIVWAMASAWLVLLVALMYSVFRWRGLGVTVTMTLIQLGGSVLIWLMLVMRALLLQATNLRTEMEAVI